MLPRWPRAGHRPAACLFVGTAVHGRHCRSSRLRQDRPTPRHPVRRRSRAPSGAKAKPCPAASPDPPRPVSQNGLRLIPDRAPHSRPAAARTLPSMGQTAAPGKLLAPTPPPISRTLASPARPARTRTACAAAPGAPSCPTPRGIASRPAGRIGFPLLAPGHHVTRDPDRQAAERGCHGHGTTGFQQHRHHPPEGLAASTAAHRAPPPSPASAMHLHGPCLRAPAATPRDRPPADRRRQSAGSRFKPSRKARRESS